MTNSELAQAIGAATHSGRLNIENTWVSQRWRYFYMAVNKAASSKIKMVLHQLEGYRLPADPFDVHARDQPGMRFVGKLSAFGASDAAEILRSSDWSRFAFVRNPYARLYSAYKNKIADLASPYIGVRAAIWRAAGNRQPDVAEVLTRPRGPRTGRNHLDPWRAGRLLRFDGAGKTAAAA